MARQQQTARYHIIVMIISISLYHAAYPHGRRWTEGPARRDRWWQAHRTSPHSIAHLRLNISSASCSAGVCARSSALGIAVCLRMTLAAGKVAKKKKKKKRRGAKSWRRHDGGSRKTMTLNQLLRINSYLAAACNVAATAKRHRGEKTA